ncbi:MAG TPA: hypothetical protein VIY52_12365 [Streptosporangiaceae bacterium]
MIIWAAGAVLAVIVAALEPGASAAAARATAGPFATLAAIIQPAPAGPHAAGDPGLPR